MSKKSQHNNILLAVIGFTAVVILVGVIGFFTLEQKDDTIQGEVEVSEYRVSCKLPGRVVELRVQEGDYVHVGDTLAILEVPEMKSQEQMLQATNAAAEAMKDLTDAGARKEQIQGAYQLVQQAEAAATIAKKTYDRMQNLFNEGVISGQKRDEAYAAYKGYRGSGGCCQKSVRYGEEWRPRTGEAHGCQQHPGFEERCGCSEESSERDRSDCPVRGRG